MLVIDPLFPWFGFPWQSITLAKSRLALGCENFRFRNFAKFSISCLRNFLRISRERNRNLGENLQFRESRNQNLGNILAI